MVMFSTGAADAKKINLMLPKRDTNKTQGHFPPEVPCVLWVSRFIHNKRSKFGVPF